MEQKNSIQKHHYYSSVSLLLLVTGMVGVGIFLLTRGQYKYTTQLPDRVTTAAPAPELAAQTSEGANPKPKPTDSNAGLLTTPPAVPFFPQAPYGQWKDPRHQDGCEEASALMAVALGQQKKFTIQQANTLIEEIAAYQEKEFGSYHDTSAQDTAKRILTGFFKYSNFEVKSNITTTDIRTALEAGNIVIVPVDGQKLHNPYFTGAGPERHMLVIIGYNPATDQFLTNDPGTRHGAGYRYSTKVLEAALRDYPSGYHEPIPEGQTAMIIVHRQ